MATQSKMVREAAILTYKRVFFLSTLHCPNSMIKSIVISQNLRSDVEGKLTVTLKISKSCIQSTFLAIDLFDRPRIKLMASQRPIRELKKLGVKKNHSSEESLPKRKRKPKDMVD